MRYDEAPLPHQMKDEDKWFTFTKSQLVKLVIVLIIPAMIWKIMMNWGYGIIGGIIFFTVLIVTGFLIKIPVPDSMYLFGSGKPMYVSIILSIRNKMRKVKKLYSKNIE